MFITAEDYRVLLDLTVNRSPTSRFRSWGDMTERANELVKAILAR